MEAIEARTREVSPLGELHVGVYTLDTGAFTSLTSRVGGSSTGRDLALGRTGADAVKWKVMRIMAAVVCAGLFWAVPADAETVRFRWPLDPRPAVTRAFDAPSPNWQRGHRGVDLAAGAHQPVYAAGPGTVVFAGELAGRPVVSIAHPGGLRTTYEPVRAHVRVGRTVAAGQSIGTLDEGHSGCPVAACLHWGAMWGPASRADYVDPVGLLSAVRLKPLETRLQSAR